MNNNMNLDINNMSLEELEQLKIDLSDKTLKIDGNLDREKAFVETMSNEARHLQEMMQQKREQRYDEMIEKAGPIESPMNRKY